MVLGDKGGVGGGGGGGEGVTKKGSWIQGSQYFQGLAGWGRCGETKHKRERGITPVMSVAKLTSLCKCLANTNFGSTVAICLPARVVAKSSTSTTASSDTISLCVASLTTGRVFATSSCGARTTIEEIIINLNV